MASDLPIKKSGRNRCIKIRFLLLLSINKIEFYDHDSIAKRKQLWVGSFKNLCVWICWRNFYNNTRKLDTCFTFANLDWVVFGLRTLDKILDFIFPFLCITPVIKVLTPFESYSIDYKWKLINWFLCGLDTVIKLNSFYIYSIYSIYLFICFMLSLLLSLDIITFIVVCCCCCCLLICFIHFAVVVLVLLFTLFYCRFSVFYYWCCQYLLTHH